MELWFGDVKADTSLNKPDDKKSVALNVWSFMFLSIDCEYFNAFGPSNSFLAFVNYAQLVKVKALRIESSILFFQIRER